MQKLSGVIRSEHHYILTNQLAVFEGYNGCYFPAAKTGHVPRLYQPIVANVGMVWERVNAVLFVHVCAVLEHMQLARDKTCFSSKVPRNLCRERQKAVTKTGPTCQDRTRSRDMSPPASSVSHLSQNSLSLSLVQVRYIPAKREIRPIISLGKGQCFREASEVKHCPSPRDITGLISRLAGIYPTHIPQPVRTEVHHYNTALPQPIAHTCTSSLMSERG